ncbi:MAG TPA: hypothetical protein PLL21_01925 [Sedimentibacter sp.]|nr:hypothetical protein [Sedimentibacter sp.]
MKRLICILLIIMFLSAGCTTLFEVDEEKVKDVSDKVTEAIINTVGQEKAEKKESRTVDSAGKSTLIVKNSVGDIDIKSHESYDTIINIKITAKSGSKQKSEEFIENYTYNIETEGGFILVDTSFEEPLSGINLITDLTVYVPSSINNTEVSTNVGTIRLDGLSGNMKIKSNVGDIIIDNSEGSYNLHVDVGDIVIRGSKALENSEFKTNTGGMEMSLDITKSRRITAETGVGDIEMSIVDDAGYQAVINEFMKDERIETKDEPYTFIDLTAGVGEINLTDI